MRAKWRKKRMRRLKRKRRKMRARSKQAVSASYSLQLPTHLALHHLFPTCDVIQDETSAFNISINGATFLHGCIALLWSTVILSSCLHKGKSVIDVCFRIGTNCMIDIITRHLHHHFNTQNILNKHCIDYMQFILNKSSHNGI